MVSSESAAGSRPELALRADSQRYGGVDMLEWGISGMWLVVI